jgi:hypothetical protein
VKPLERRPTLSPRCTRQTWTAARLQTLEGGEPITILQVAEELGHADSSTTAKFYKRLGIIKQRSKYVEFVLTPAYRRLLAREVRAFERRLAVYAGREAEWTKARADFLGRFQRAR